MIPKLKGGPSHDSGESSTQNTQKLSPSKCREKVTPQLSYKHFSEQTVNHVTQQNSYCLYVIWWLMDALAIGCCRNSILALDSCALFVNVWYHLKAGKIPQRNAITPHIANLTPKQGIYCGLACIKSNVFYPGNTARCCQNRMYRNVLMGVRKIV